MFVHSKSNLAILLSLTFMLTEALEGFPRDDDYPIFDITTYIQGVLRQNDSKANELLKGILKEELSQTLYYIADPTQTVFETFNETFVFVSNFIAEIDTSNSVQLKRKFVVVLKQFHHNLFDEAHWANGIFSQQASQILKKSLAAVIVELSTLESCDGAKGFPDMNKHFEIIRRIQQMTKVRVGFGYTHEKHCSYINLESYFPSEIAVKSVVFRAEVGFPDTYYAFTLKLQDFLHEQPTFFGDNNTVLNPIITLRVNLLAYNSTYNDEFRTYQALLRQYVIRWQVEKGSSLIFNMINEYKENAMFPTRTLELENSYENVSSSTIPFLFMRDLLPSIDKNCNCLNKRLGQIASKFDTVLLDFEAWRYIMFQKEQLKNSSITNPYAKACDRSDIENYNLKVPSKVFLLANVTRCEGAMSCIALLEQVLTTVENNMQLRGMSVKGVIFAFGTKHQNRRRVQWNLPASAHHFENISFGCFQNYGTLKNDYDWKTIGACPIDFKTSRGRSVVSIWEFRMDHKIVSSTRDSGSDDGSDDFYTKTIQRPLYKIKSNLRKLEEGHQVILKLVSNPARKGSYPDASLFCDWEVLVINTLTDWVTTWARIHKIKLIVKPAFDTATEVGWWSRIDKENGYEIVARNYPKYSNFGSDPCIPHMATLTDKMVLDSNRTGITIDMNIRKEQPLNGEEVKMLIILALHVSPTIEFVPRYGNTGEFISDLEIITASISDSNLHKTLQLNGIKSGRFFVKFDARVLVDSRKTIHTFLKACRNNFSKLKIAGIHISLAYAEINPKKVLDILEEIRSTTDLGVDFEVCPDEEGDRNPKTLEFLENTSYLVFKSFEFHHATTSEEEEKFYLQARLDRILACQRRVLTSFPKLQKIYFRQEINFDSEGRTEYSAISRYVKRQYFGNLHATVYNISNFIVGFDERKSYYRGYNDNGWWYVNNYLDLANSSVFAEKQAIYFNEPNWQPVSRSLEEEDEANSNESISRFSGESDSKFTTTDADKEAISWTVIIISALSICIFLALLFTMYRFHQFRRHSPLVLTRKEVAEFHEGISSENNPNGSEEVDFLCQKFSKNFEIPKSELILDNRHILGRGNFGLVYEANVKGTPVAVKVPHDNCAKETFRSFLCEVKILAYLGTHPNLIEFVGCHTKEIEKGVIYIATGLCELGSLQNHLRKEVSGNNVRVDELIRYCFEISSGMEYISKKNVVHGDLSTRNVLLDKDFTCKIGDFGLSRKLYEYSKYVKTSQEPLPWRWMAYESLVKMEFTSKSDVWSYGVTLWEIFSQGAIPYPGMAWTTTFAEDLKKGLRMESPELATKDIFRQMRGCWKLDSDARPDFCELRDFFLALRNQLVYTELCV